MLRTPLLSLILLLLVSNTATLDDIDEGSGITVDSSVIAGSAIVETDRKIPDPFLSSPPKTVHKLLPVDSNAATLDDVDEGSGITVDSSVIAGSAILETDRKIPDPFLSSPPRTVHKDDNSIDEVKSNNMPLISTLKNLSASLPFDMGQVMVEKEQAHNYATTVTEDSFSHRITLEEAGNMSIKGNHLPNNTKIEKRMATSSDRENRSSHLASDTLSKEGNSSISNINEVTVANTNNTTSKNANASTSILPTSESSVVSLSTPMVEDLSQSTTDNGSLLDNASESEGSPTTSGYASLVDKSTIPNDGNPNKVDDKSSIISATLGSNATSKTNTSKSSLDRTSTPSAYQVSEFNTKNLLNQTSTMQDSTSSTVTTSSDTDPLMTENEIKATSVYKSSTVSSEVPIDGNTSASDGNAPDETKSSTLLLTTTVKHEEDSSISTESNADPPIPDGMIAGISSHLHDYEYEYTTISVTTLPSDTDGSSSVNASYTAKPKFTTVSSIEFSSKEDSSTIKTLSTAFSVESTFTTTVDEITVETGTENVVSEINFSSTFEPPKEISTLGANTITTKSYVEPFTTNVPIDLKEDTTSVEVEKLEQRGSQTESSHAGSTILTTPKTVLSVIDTAPTTLSTVERMNIGPVPVDLTLFPATPSFIEDEELNQELFPDDTTVYLPLTSTKAQDIGNDKEASQSNLPSTEVSTNALTESTQSITVTHELSTEVTGPANNTTHPSQLTTLTVTEPGISATQLFALTGSTINEPGNNVTQPPLPVSTVTEPGNITQPSSLATIAGGEPGNNSTQYSQLTTTIVTELSKNATQPSPLSTTTVTEPSRNGTQPSLLLTTTVTENSKNITQPSPLSTTTVTEPGNNAIQTSPLITATVFEAGNNATQPPPLTTTTVTELGNNSLETSPLTTTTVIKPGNTTTQPLTLTTTMITELESITTQPSPLTTITVTELGNITTKPSQLTTITVNELGNITSQPSQFTTITVTEPGTITTQPSQLTTATVPEPQNITKPSQLTTTTVTEHRNLTTQPSLTNSENITGPLFQVTTTTVPESENITTQPSQLTTTTVTEPGNVTMQPSQWTTTTVMELGNLTTQLSLIKPGNITTQSSPTEFGNITAETSQLTTATVPEPGNVTTQPGNISTQPSQLLTTTVIEKGNIGTEPTLLTTIIGIESGNIGTQPSQLTTTTGIESGNIATQPSQLANTTVTTQPSQFTTTTVTEPGTISTQPSQLITETVPEPQNITEPSQLTTTTVTEHGNITTQPSQLTTTTVIEPGNITTQPSQLTTTTVTKPGNKVTEPSQFPSTILASDPTVLNTSQSPQLEQSTVDVSSLIRNGNASFFEENESTTDAITLDDLTTNPSFYQSTQIGENDTSLDQSTQPFADDATFIPMTTSRSRKPDQECVTYRGPDAGRSCTFPFFYHGKIFFQCTYSDDINEAWCSTEVDSQYRYITSRWGYCNDACPKEKSPCVTTGPSGREGLPCVFPFHYMHLMFWGCTSLPSPGTGESRPWCPTALDDHLDVLDDNWGYCSRKCLGSGDILIESPLFTDTSAFDQLDKVSSTSSISTSLQTEMSTVAVQTSLSTTELDKIKPTEMPLGNANLTEIPCETKNVTEIPLEVNLTERPPANMNQTEMPFKITNVLEIPLEVVFLPLLVAEIPLEVNSTEKPTANMNRTEIPFGLTNVTEISHVSMKETEMPLNVTEIPFLDTTKTLPVDMNVTEIPAVNTNTPELPAANTTLTGSTTETFSNQNSNQSETVEFVTVSYKTYDETTQVSQNLLVTNTTIRNGTEIVVTSSPNSQSNASMTESPDATFSDQTELPVHSTTWPQIVSTDKAVRICGNADRVPPQDHVLYIPSGCWDPVLELLGE